MLNLLLASYLSDLPKTKDTRGVKQGSKTSFAYQKRMVRQTEMPMYTNARPRTFRDTFCMCKEL